MNPHDPTHQLLLLGLVLLAGLSGISSVRAGSAAEQ